MAEKQADGVAALYSAMATDGKLPTSVRRKASVALARRGFKDKLLAGVKDLVKAQMSYKAIKDPTPEDDAKFQGEMANAAVLLVDAYLDKMDLEHADELMDEATQAEAVAVYQQRFMQQQQQQQPGR
jgi:hypothetical protein